MASIAELIAADLASRRKRVDVVHPLRPEYRVTYRLPVDETEFEAQRKAALDASKTGKPMHFTASVLAVLCEQIVYQGQVLTQADGSPATFTSAEVLSALGVTTSAADAVVALYGSSFIADAVYANLMSSAGAGSASDVEVIDQPDPTSAG